MKKTKIAFWIITGLFSAFMLFSAYPDAVSSKEALDFFKQIGYPAYMAPFLGIAKILGVIAILIPGYPRIKEWAYAGLVFDLLGATYSIMCTIPNAMAAVFMTVTIGFAFASYFLYHKLRKEKGLE